MPDMNSKRVPLIERLRRNTTLTVKMVLLSLMVGFILWALTDYIQNRYFKSILEKQHRQRISQLAIEYRMRFDRYVKRYSQSVKLFSEQKGFNEYLDYLEKKNWSERDDFRIKHYLKPPGWFPSSSVMRTFIQVNSVFLSDSRKRVREVYQRHGSTLVDYLNNPDTLLYQLSRNQSFLTTYDNKPYIIASKNILGTEGQLRGILTLVSSIDEEFISLSQGVTGMESLVALTTGSKPYVIASNNKEMLPPGTEIDALRERFLIGQEDFFDYGNSDLLINLAIFQSKDEIESQTDRMLGMVRMNKFIGSIVLILFFTMSIYFITRRIHKLTRYVIDFKNLTLGTEDSGMKRGDEIEVLKEYFQNVTEELAETNKKINGNRIKLQSALDEIHSLLQNVIWNEDFNAALHNPNLKKCYETLNCKNEKCSCHGTEPVRCWQVVGTFCGGKLTGDFTTKQEDCMKCAVFLEATTDPVYRIREHFNNMMHAVEIKNRELEDAYKEISYTQVKVVQQEKMATIGQLAAGVAHEINNPTGFISSNLGTLGNYLNKLTEFIAAQNAALEFVKAEETVENMKEMRKKLKIDYVLEDVGELISESLDGADRIKNIVQNLKTFARVDEKEYKEADINECIESTLNIVWNELKYKADVKKEYSEIPSTMCYPQKLNQVFMNLLVNAGQAIEKQGEIKIKTWNGGEFINISISDTGQGIPEEEIEKIFEPFFTTKEAGKGTGLGLSISHEIVQKHNGNLSVESEIGKGTTFNIKIPVVESI